MNQCALLPAEKPSYLLNTHSAQISQISLKTKEGTNTTDGKALPSNLQNQLLSEIIVPEHVSHCRFQRSAAEFKYSIHTHLPAYQSLESVA